MHRRVKTILTGILLIAFFLSGCVTPVLVDYDHEAAAGFEAYQYFAIDTSETQESSESMVFSPIANRRFKRAIETTLKERGYIKDDSKADFIIEFHADKKTVTEIDFYNNIYSRRGSYYPSTFPDIGFFPPPYVDQYDEGTLYIDIIDAQSKELVWRGTYIERLGRRPHTAEEIHSIINSILNRFPPEYIKATR